MSPQQHIAAAELHRHLHGSREAHQSLQASVLWILQRLQVPAVPLFTGGKPYPVGEGLYRLGKNQEQVGISDVLACLPPAGRMWLIELKTGAASRSTVQIARQKEFAAAGALTSVVRSVDAMMKIARELLPGRFAKAFDTGRSA